MDDGSLRTVDDVPANLTQLCRIRPMNKTAKIGIRRIMQALDLEDALAEAVQHARHFGEHDVALSLAMILEDLRVRLWDVSDLGI